MRPTWWMREAWSDLRALVPEAGRAARRYRLVLGACAALGAAIVLAVLPYDTAFVQWIGEHRPASLRPLAKVLRRWGDFRDTATLTAVVFTLGLARRRRTWRRAAVTCFTAAALAGLASNAVRFTAGRPRPPAGMPYRLYGPTFSYRRQSFPSGHATTSTASAVALAVAWPAAGVPALASAAGVIASCLYLRVHYPTDVLAGLTLGLLFGAVFGVAARRLAARAPPGDGPAR